MSDSGHVAQVRSMAGPLVWRGILPDGIGFNVRVRSIARLGEDGAAPIASYQSQPYPSPCIYTIYIYIYTVYNIKTYSM